MESARGIKSIIATLGERAVFRIHRYSVDGIV
jgi:hypothetical protein